MKKTQFILNSLSFCWFAFVLLLSAIVSEGFAQRKEDPAAGIEKYNTAMQIIKFAYVDSVKESKLVETAIIETLKELDPHSVYISKEEVAKANEPLQGNFEGIGIQFQIYKDTIMVVHPIPGGPSEKLGIMSGDKIVKINEENVTGKKVTNQFVFDRLRGKKGTKVTISIYRKGHKGFIDYTITRDKIPINSIDASLMASGDIGYINLNRFSSTSDQEFREALIKLEAQGMKKLILDLRNNAGGYLNAAVDLSDEFLPSGKLIVYTEGLRAIPERYSATSRGLFEKGRLVVLINENSASASEIVSGAVQDWDRGIIIGRRSFGKGLVQRPFQLPDSSQIRLTTARYHTPTGRCIQKPYVEGTDEYYHDFSKRMKHGELVHQDSIKFPDSLKYHTPAGRIVYGGGGIMPDVFVPWDSTIYTDYYMDLRRKDIINRYVTQYVDENRKDLQKKYPAYKNFKQGFTISNKMLDDFLAMAEKDSIKKNEKQLEISRVLILSQIKGLIAQKLWDYNAYYESVMDIDPEFNKAIEVLNDDHLFATQKIQE